MVEGNRRKTVARKLKPVLRRIAHIEFTGSLFKAKVSRDESNTLMENESKRERFKRIEGLRQEKDRNIKSQLGENSFELKLLQLGAEYTIEFPRVFLELLGEFETKFEIMLSKKRVSKKMKGIEDAEELGRINKKRVGMVSLGIIEKETRAFFHCDTSLVTSPLEWKGIVIIKRMETPPVSAATTIVAFTNFEMASEAVPGTIEKSQIVLPPSMELNLWDKGMSLATIRSIIKPRLKYYDRDNSGNIDFDEFKSSMENMGVFIPEIRLQKLFQACDLDRSGEIDLEELPLAICINNKLREKSYMSPKDAFELFDYDGSGQLNEHEFYEVVQTLSKDPISREQCSVLFAKSDKDKSGEIDLHEFREIWLGYCDLEVEIDRRHECKRSTGFIAFIPSFNRRVLKTKLRQLILEEEKQEEIEFENACEIVYAEARKLRLEIDLKKKEHHRERKRQYLISKQAISKSERETRRQQAFEMSHRTKILDRENVLKHKIAIEIAERSERDKAEKKVNREIALQQERKSRARRGDDRLDLSHSKLRNIDPSVYRGKGAQNVLSYLVYLDLSNNDLNELPSEGFLFWCGTVRFMDLSRNKIVFLPQEIGSMESLQELDLRKNNLTHLPASIGDLKSLVSLNISENKLKCLPSELGNSVSLETIIAYKNCLEIIPPEIGKLDALVTLNISLNNLKELPEEFGTLKSLQMLDVSWNNLQKLPTGINNMNSLQVLNLSSNDLRRLPTVLESLTRLRVLNISRNNLIEISASIGGLASLLKLDVSHNRILRLPDEIGLLRAIQILELSQNRIASLPFEMGRLKQLVSLQLCGNELATLPEELGACCSLQQLNVSGNRLIGVLPDSLGALENLCQCNVSRNQLTSLPVTIGAWTNLVCLNAGFNRLQEIPDTIGCLASIQTIQVPSNRIKEIPPSIGNLHSSLEHLDLCSNQLKWIPKEIGFLKKLKTLELHHNMLQAVPAEVGLLVPQLGQFSVSHNPLSEFPPKLITDLRSKNRSGFVWSGYSDGQVADYVVEISHVHRECINAHQSTLSLQEFTAVVRDSMELKSTWRNYLIQHVNHFYFRAKKLGTVPLLEALYGKDLEARIEIIARTNEDRKRVEDTVKNLEMDNAIVQGNAYQVTPQKLVFTQSKLDQRKVQLAKESKMRAKQIIKTAGKSCFDKQDSIFRATEEKRRKQKEEEMNQWMDHFREKRMEYENECLEKFGYQRF